VDILDLAKIELSPALKSVLDLSTPIPTKSKSLGAAELAEAYRGKDIPVHRFAFKEIAGFIEGTTSLNAEALTSLLPESKSTRTFSTSCSPKPMATSVTRN
jgi:hypothetical protein